MGLNVTYDNGLGRSGVVSDANGDTLDVGDVVELISGGPDMTVLDVCTDCGTVDVGWFNGHKFKWASLPAEVLALVTVH